MIADDAGAGDAAVAAVPGDWGIIQGFDSGETHVRYAAFALDFVPGATEDDARARSPARRWTAFACYGRPGARARRRHRRARQRRRARLARLPQGSDPGNYVIIQHAPGEYTEFRHLAASSVALAPGARVRRGETIGRRGNSGNAGMPHLHIGFLSAIDPITTRARCACPTTNAPGPQRQTTPGTPATGFP